MKLKEIKQECISRVEKSFDREKAQWIVKRVLEDIFSITSRDFILFGDEERNIDFSKLDSIIERVCSGEPLQYICSFEEFLGRKFSVSPSVLIPRPETEELVLKIIEENEPSDSLSILDIGTGSGAIAISLALAFKNSKIEAWDVSEKAIEVAKFNKQNLGAENLVIKHQDLFKAVAEEKKYDIIVSNPPYITESEKSLMDKNVLDFEPQLALFVDDNTPLIFYSKIGELATKSLKKGGKLYFEINENFGDDTAQMLSELGYSNIEVLKDFRDRVRFVKGIYYGI